MTPLGFLEELELERHAAGELERRAVELYAAGGLPARAAAIESSRQARAAREHVAELELELAGFTKR